MFGKNISQLSGPIAVFGAGGFVGANLFIKLFEERNDVYAITQQPYEPWRLSGIAPKNVLQADVTSATSIEDLFNLYKFKTIFVFSAYGAYSRQTDAKKIYETNVIGLLNILSSAEKHGFSALVHAGSSSEYGLNSAAPSENEVLQPNSHYAVSKVSASYLIFYYGKIKNLPVINLRLYSVYGPLEEEDRLIPRLVTAGIQKKYPPLVGPEISRDFLYVDDCINASIIAAIKGVSVASGESINISTGIKTTLSELARVSQKIFGITEEPVFGTMPNRNWDLNDWYGSSEKAKSILDWKPLVSLEEGLTRTCNAIQEKGTGPLLKQKIQKIPRISAIVACYKDAEAIPIMHKRLRTVFEKLKVDFEIIFVNDQSPDNTNATLEAICRSDFKVLAIEHSRNFGSQSAFLSGMEISTGDAVVLLDGDLQDPPEIIPQFYAEWINGFQVVYGRRVRREASFLQNIFYKSFYRVFNKIAYIPIPLDAGDFSLIDRKVVNEMLALPESEQFLRGLRAWVGFRQIGVDYHRPERLFGVSTNNFRKNFWWARKAIFSFSFVPLELLIYIGLFLTGASFFGLIWQVGWRLLFPDTPHGFTTLIVLILFFGGVQLLSISIIGEYIGKILEETKRRPKFIRQSVRIGNSYLESSAQIQRFLSDRKSVKND